MKLSRRRVSPATGRRGDLSCSGAATGDSQTHHQRDRGHSRQPNRRIIIHAPFWHLDKENNKEQRNCQNGVKHKDSDGVSDASAHLGASRLNIGDSSRLRL